VTIETELTSAEEKSRQARAQLTGTLVDIQSRLNPRTLIWEAVAEVREAGTELIRAGLASARRNPGPMLGIAATIAAYVARDWFVTHARTEADPLPPPPAKKPARPRQPDPKRPPRRKRA
jgi:ApbE superfamily uncharacterized protein (UPF0280 family)